MNAIFSPLTDGDLKRIGLVILLIVFNFLFAVVGALFKGGFDPQAGGLDFKKLPEFFYKQVLPYVVGLAFFEAFLHVVSLGDTVTLLFGGHISATTDATGAVVPPSTTFQWLDPASLWTVYASMVAMLVKSLLVNGAYLFGRGISAAQQTQ